MTSKTESFAGFTVFLICFRGIAEYGQDVSCMAAVMSKKIKVAALR